MTDDRGTGRVTVYRNALTSSGVPENLAQAAAEILHKETTSWEAGTSYERTPEEQHVVHSAHTWMLASGGTHETK